MKSPWTSYIFGLAVLTLSPAAMAGPWGSTFSPTAIETYLQGNGLKVAVVAASQDDHPDTEQASKALADAIRKTGKSTLVLGPRALSNCAGKSDQEIVACSNALDMDVISVVRVFQGDAGQAPNAVVVFYDQHGNAVRALNGRKGIEVDSVKKPGKIAQREAGHGVSKKAVDTITKITERDGYNKENAIERYERNALNIREKELVNLNTGAVHRRWSEITRGKFSKPIEPEDFYSIVGRADLAAKYKSANTTRVTLMIAGWAGLGIGTAVMLSSDIDDGGFVGGAVGMTAGGLVALAATFVDPHPVSPSEMRELAGEYNDRLKKKLGLSDASDVLDDDEVNLELALIPVFHAGGAGLNMALKF